jgi:multidrug efflux system membrane fusion protein
MLDQAVAKKAQDEAMLANARLDLERYTRLAATNSATKQQADTQRAMVNQLEAQVKADQAMIDNTRAILNYTTITAPLSGRTGIRLVDEGNIVRAADPTGIVVITQIKPISVFFNLPQQYLVEINKGLSEGPLPVEALQNDGKTVADKGQLVVIDNLVDQTTGTVRLKAEFPNAQLQLWPGQFVNIRLLLDTRRQVVVVPTASVQRGPNGTFVYVVGDDDTATVRPVTVVQQDDVQAVIGKGLRPAERVVTTGFVRLTEGSRVRVTNTEDGKRPPPVKAGPEASRREDGTARPGRPKRDNVGAGPGGPRGEGGERGEKGRRSQVSGAPPAQP